MLTILSPSKTIKFTPPEYKVSGFQPRYLRYAASLAQRMKSMDMDEISTLMQISPDLARLTVERFQQWHTPFTEANATPALFTFRGDVYEGLDANSLSQEDVEFAHGSIRILSGLYGVLRPLDLMQPYRLEMGRKVTMDGSSNLYEYWDNMLVNDLLKELRKQAIPVLVNLASQEYFKSIAPIAKQIRVVTPNFYESASGKPRMVAIYAKRARGLMARFVVKERIEDPEQLKLFDAEGYVFSPNASKGDTWVFIR